jgi:sulfide:quinone oxidoreductase
MDEQALHVVIAGGGVPGLEAILALRALAGDRVAITLLDPDEEFVYKPLSVQEPFAHASAQRLPLRKLEQDFGVVHRRDSLARVRPDDHVAVTGSGEEIAYGALIAAVGARRRPAFQGVATFRGPEDSELLRGLVQDVEEGYSRRIAFVVPGGVTWPLPLYELALMTAARARAMGAEVEITVVTPEPLPLAVLGEQASADVAELLTIAGIRLEADTFADVDGTGRLFLRPAGSELTAERIVALPVLEGPAIPGLPADERGFVPTEAHGRVPGAPDVYAAGDGTQNPIKQGGLATQQADIIAGDVARRVGVRVEEAAAEPVLRVTLLTGDKERYATDRPAEGESGLADHALWWPPGKIAGAYLSPYLAGPDAPPPPPGREALEIELPLSVPPPT